MLFAVCIREEQTGEMSAYRVGIEWLIELFIFIFLDQNNARRINMECRDFIMQEPEWYLELRQL